MHVGAHCAKNPSSCLVELIDLFVILDRGLTSAEEEVRNKDSKSESRD